MVRVHPGSHLKNQTKKMKKTIEAVVQLMNTELENMYFNAFAKIEDQAKEIEDLLLKEIKTLDDIITPKKVGNFEIRVDDYAIYDDKGERIICHRPGNTKFHNTNLIVSAVFPEEIKEIQKYRNHSGLIGDYVQLELYKNPELLKNKSITDLCEDFLEYVSDYK